MKETIGIFSLQGDFLEHEVKLKSLNPDLNIVHVTYAEQIEHINRLILPGGESTTMNKLGNHNIRQTRLLDALKSRLLNNHLPVLATCAGIILLSKQIESFPANTTLKPYLNVLPIKVLRNHYGRQQQSFETSLNVKGLDSEFKGVFIRAPLIEMLPESSDIEILAQYQNNPVLIKYNNIIATTFHPELVPDERIHKMFLAL